MATASLQTGRFKYNDGGWYVGQVRTPKSVQVGRQAIALAFQRHRWWLHPGGCIAVLCLVPRSHVALRSLRRNSSTCGHIGRWSTSSVEWVALFWQHLWGT